MRGPGSQAPSRGSTHARTGRHPLLARLARPFQGGLAPAVTAVATSPGPAQGQRRPVGTGLRWCWQVGLQCSLTLSHLHLGCGPALQVTADNISAGPRLVIGKAHFSQRKDRNRSSGELRANQKTPARVPWVQTPRPPRAEDGSSGHPPGGGSRTGGRS